MRDKFGEEAAQELARESGYQSGAAIFNTYRAKIGVPPGEALTPEQFVEFQGIASHDDGCDSSYAFSGYDEEKASGQPAALRVWRLRPITNARPVFAGSAPTPSLASSPPTRSSSRR